jgi:hypothetical protein
MPRRIMVICLCLGVLSTVMGCYVGGNVDKPYRDYPSWTRGQENPDEWRLNHPHPPINPQSAGD